MRKWYKKQEQLLAEIETTVVTDDEVAIWYVGQCGFIIKQKVVIYIDPVFNEIYDDNGKNIRNYEIPFRSDDAYADYVLITHEHVDHMAEETIKGIYRNNRSVKFLVPGFCKATIVGWNIDPDNVIEIQAGTVKRMDGFSVKGISTAHPVHQCSKLRQEYSLAYDIGINDIHILHLGDTVITERLIHDLKEIYVPDVFMVPINGSDYFRTRNGIIGNMSYGEAVILAKELKAELTIPMHYDLIEGNTVNPMYFMQEFMEKVPQGSFKIPALGERMIYKK